MPRPVAIVNGCTVPVADANLSLFDTGFVHGAAVGDMIRTFRHEPFRLDDHLQRLRNGIDALGIPDAPSDNDYRNAVQAVVRHNAGLIPKHHDLGVIMFATAGWNRSYLGSAHEPPATCTWGVHTFPLPFEFWAEKMRHGQHLVIPPARHIPAECLNGRIKWRSRVHWFLADRQAREANPAASALLLDRDGHITETSTANFFVVKNGRILTPRSDNTLDGISRRVVFELAAELGIPCEWTNIGRGDVLSAEEAFTSSSSTCLMPVATLDGERIGGEIPGSVYRRVMAEWNKLAGLNIIEQIFTGAKDRTLTE